jgi:hypothetical protein
MTATESLSAAEQSLISVIRAATDALQQTATDDLDAALRDFEAARQAALARLSRAAVSVRVDFQHLATDTQEITRDLAADLFGAPAKATPVEPSSEAKAAPVAPAAPLTAQDFVRRELPGFLEPAPEPLLGVPAANGQQSASPSRQAVADGYNPEPCPSCGAYKFIRSGGQHACEACGLRSAPEVVSVAANGPCIRLTEPQSEAPAEAPASQQTAQSDPDTEEAKAMRAAANVSPGRTSRNGRKKKS